MYIYHFHKAFIYSSTYYFWNLTEHKEQGNINYKNMQTTEVKYFKILKLAN